MALVGAIFRHSAIASAIVSAIVSTIVLTIVLTIVAVVVSALLLAACAPWQPNPGAAGEGRSGSAAAERVTATPPAWYRVRRGDTLYSIAFRYGLDWRNVARWNSIESPYTIRPGQELRMSAPPAPIPRQPSPEPGGSSGRAGSESGSGAGQPQLRPVEPRPSENPAAVQSSDQAAASSASSNARTIADVTWQWPTQGRLARAFDPSDTRKGIGVAGEFGQDVLAAASGQVVYSGTALIGYGELIIIKHSDKLLSAYGHNSRRVVREGERVQRGQKIAEMGRNDRQEEMLHFEIRRDGEPVNPLDFLPKR